MSDLDALLALIPTGPEPEPVPEIALPPEKLPDYAVIKPQHRRKPTGFRIILVQEGSSRELMRLGEEATVDDAKDVAREEVETVYEWLDCVLCGNPCYDGYMVHDETWREAGLGDGLAHLRCLEGRLGYRLSLEHFTSAPINDMLRVGFAMGERSY